MINDFFSSDHHFFHEKICGFAGRPFAHLPDMHERLIADHNAVVKPGDRWWCVGDFSFGDSAASTQMLKRMNGQKFLIKGNHDHRHRTADGWMWIKDYHEVTIANKDGAIPERANSIVLSHFPFLSWHKMHYGAYHLHGHSHGNLVLPEQLKQARILDVGVDNIWKMRENYSPLEWEEVRALLRYAEPVSIDHHKVRP